MSETHDRLRDLVLGLDDLEGPERARAQHHYEECESCRRLLDAVRDVERRLRAMPEIPIDSPDPLEGLDDPARAAAARSREELLARAGGGPPRSKASPLRRPRTVVPLLLAAAVAVVLLWPAAETESIVTDFTVEPAVQTRGEDAAAWEEGDAFVLRFELERVGHPFVIHLGDEAMPTLLHPDSVDEPVPAAAAGVDHRLPPLSDPEAWVFEGRGTRETFLLCTSLRGDLALGPLLRTLRERAAAASSREEAVRAVREHLQREIGPTVQRDLRLRG